MAEEVKEVKEVKQEIVKAEPKTVPAQRNMIADLDNGIFGSSDTFKLACQYAKGLASSTMVPVLYQKNEGNCLIAIEIANRTRQSAFQVMQSLDIIQGTPCWRAKALLGMINVSKKYDEDLSFMYTKDENGNVKGCYAYTTRNGKEVRGTEYTYEMARKAKLFDKANSHWNKESELMLTYRAISRFSSLQCPEISLGMYVREEVIDMLDEEQTSTPKRATINSILKADDIDVVEIVTDEV